MVTTATPAAPTLDVATSSTGSPRHIVRWTADCGKGCLYVAEPSNDAWELVDPEFEATMHETLEAVDSAARAHHEQTHKARWLAS